MSRTEGFDVMDVSTSLPNDPKFRRLAREFPDQLGTAFFAYVATMAESWKAGERVSVDVAWPSILPHDDRAVDALSAVSLLDPKGRVTVSAWRDFFEQARIRREKSRERWRRANEHRGKKPDDLNGNDSAESSRLPRGAHAVTAPPSDSVRPTESESLGSHGAKTPERARQDRATSSKDGADGPRLTKAQLEAWRAFGSEWDDVKAAWLGRGLRHPPAGDPDDDRSQRALLYEILDARPTDLVRWIRDAPAKLGSDELVGHVLAKWKAVKAEVEADVDEVPWLRAPSRPESAASIAERVVGRG